MQSKLDLTISDISVESLFSTVHLKHSKALRDRKLITAGIANPCVLFPPWDNICYGIRKLAKGKPLFITDKGKAMSKVLVLCLPESPLPALQLGTWSVYPTLPQSSYFHSFCSRKSLLTISLFGNWWHTVMSAQNTMNSSCKIIRPNHTNTYKFYVINSIDSHKSVDLCLECSSDSSQFKFDKRNRNMLVTLHK